MGRVLFFAFALSVACSSNNTPSPDAAGSGSGSGSGGKAAFGSDCTVVSDMSTECASGVCIPGDTGFVCASSCVRDGASPHNM